MRSVVAKTSLALALSALSALLVACGGGQGDDSNAISDGSAKSPGGWLPLSLPDDFPLYPGLNIVDTLVLGDLYIFEARSQGQREDVIDFYEKELAKGRWQLVSADSSPEVDTIFFTAPGFSADGRLAVSQDKEKDARITVAIALPIDALGGTEE